MKQNEIESYQETIEIWKDLYPDEELTLKDGEEIQRDITGFFNALIEWDKKEALK